MCGLCFEIIYRVLLIVQKGHSAPDGQRAALNIQVDDERNANLLRTQILRFNDELIDDKHHTREHFIEILAIIDAYEDYCRSHPDYKNNRCICAVANIKRVYNERLQKHDFS